jgi:hypothetical protein
MDVPIYNSPSVYPTNNSPILQDNLGSNEHHIDTRHIGIDLIIQNHLHLHPRLLELLISLIPLQIRVRLADYHLDIPEFVVGLLYGAYDRAGVGMDEDYGVRVEQLFAVYHDLVGALLQNVEELFGRL